MYDYFYAELVEILEMNNNTEILKFTDTAMYEIFKDFYIFRYLLLDYY